MGRASTETSVFAARGDIKGVNGIAYVPVNRPHHLGEPAACLHQGQTRAFGAAAAPVSVRLQALLLGASVDDAGERAA
jgi:hypothetical protein